MYNDDSNRQTESYRDFRYGLYERDQPVGQGEHFEAIMVKRRIERMRKRQDDLITIWMVINILCL